MAGGMAEAERPGDAHGQALAAEAARRFSHATGAKAEGFRYRVDGDVPAARGLGSSAILSAGVLAGLDALYGTGLTRDRLVAMTTELEGHPDNASSSILGGFCVSRCDPATGAWATPCDSPFPPAWFSLWFPRKWRF